MTSSQDHVEPACLFLLQECDIPDDIYHVEPHASSQKAKQLVGIFHVEAGCAPFQVCVFT
jgi:hypothetical protein